MPNTTRRNFLKNSLVAATALSLPACVRMRTVGANGDIRIAVVGFGGRGASHISGFRSLPSVRIVALCDVDKNILARGAADFEKRNQKVATYTDIRALLESKEIDAI